MQTTSTSPQELELPRVLLVTRYFPPLDSIATLRMHSWAKYLDERGWSISVLTTSKRGQVVNPLSLDVSRFDVNELEYFDLPAALGVDKATHDSEPDRGKGVSRIVRQRSARFYRERLNERMPGRTDPWIFPARRELRRRLHRGVTYDYVISSYGPPAAHVIGHYASKIFNAKWVADYRDLWLENHVFTGVWPATHAERLIERWIVSRADLITTVSDGLAEVLRGKFPSVPVAVIENGYEPEMMDRASDNYFDGTPRKARVVYTGSIFRGRRDPSPLFQAITELLDEQLLEEDALEVLFYGSSLGDLPALINSYGLAGLVQHRGAVSQEEAHAIQKSADLLLFLESADPAVDGILTGKLFEYLYVDTPVLAVGVSGDSAPGRVLARAGAGIVCGEDVPLIRENLLRLVAGEVKVSKDHEYVATFSRERQVARLAGLMEDMR